jgi:hypothetical protein
MTLAALDGLGHDPAAQSHFQQLVDVGDADAEASGAVAVGTNLQITLAA